MATKWCITISIALIFAISSQFEKPIKVEDTPPPTPPSAASEVNPSINLPSEEKDTATNTETPPEQVLPPQTDKEEQKIQPDPVKPEPPEPPKLPEGIDEENPDQKPEYKPEDTEKKPEENPPASNGNSIPGFDNVPDGGANTVIIGESDGDINKQVGTMD